MMNEIKCCTFHRLQKSNPSRTNTDYACRYLPVRSCTSTDSGSCHATVVKTHPKVLMNRWLSIIDSNSYTKAQVQLTVEPILVCTNVTLNDR